MQADGLEQNQLQILSHLIPIDNFDHKIITSSFQGVASPDTVCPVCHEQFHIGNIFLEIITLGCIATK